MKLRIASDLHFEFHADGGAHLASDVTSGDDFDVLVVAGDLSDKAIIARSLSTLAVMTKKPIVFVPGNHEFYGSTKHSTLEAIDSAALAYPHLHVLNDSTVTIDGQRFVGTPLWFRRSNAPKALMNDFVQISRFDSWVYPANEAAERFLAAEVRATDIVVTHYLPTPESIAPEYRGSPLNPFFLCDLTTFIRAETPKLWVHGHTHSSCDYEVRGWESGFSTRVVCNPFGYAGHEENPKFSAHFTVEV